MNLLTQLPKLGKRKAKRLGRGIGNGKGKKSTRGITRHQKAKTDTPLYFEGGQAKLVKKYPLLRGKGKNKSVKAKPAVLSLEKLNALSDNNKVDVALLVKQGIVTSSYARNGLKVVGGGKLEKSLTVHLPVSQSAKKAIEAAGGTVQHASDNR